MQMQIHVFGETGHGLECTIHQGERAIGILFDSNGAQDARPLCCKWCYRPGITVYPETFQSVLDDFYATHSGA